MKNISSVLSATFAWTTPCTCDEKPLMQPRKNMACWHVWYAHAIAKPLKFHFMKHDYFKQIKLISGSTHAYHDFRYGVLHKRATTHFKFFKLHVGSCPFSFWLGTTALPVWPLTCTYGSVQATAFVWSNASEWFFQVMHGIQFNLGQHVSNSATSFQEA